MPTSTATPTQTLQPSYSTHATTSPASVPRGSIIWIEASVTSGTASTALIDLEIYDSAGYKVFEHFWDNQPLAAGRPRAYKVKWLVPTTATTGVYVVKIGVFKAGGSAVYDWNDGAAVFTVT
jgi:hypothetical protein